MSMTISDYQKIWEDDVQVAPDQLDTEARNVPLLHAKWWRYYTTERLRFKMVDMEYKTLYRQRWEYWLGKMDDTERVQLGWPPQPLKILQPQVDKYLDADPVLQEASKKKIVLEETLRFMEDVIKNINNRGYLLRTMMDFLRWKSGV